MTDDRFNTPLKEQLERIDPHTNKAMLNLSLIGQMITVWLLETVEMTHQESPESEPETRTTKRIVHEEVGVLTGYLKSIDANTNEFFLKYFMTHHGSGYSQVRDEWDYEIVINVHKDPAS